MTEYINRRNNEIMTALNDDYECSLYLKQAQKIYETTPGDLSFLPITPLPQNADILCYDLTRDIYSPSRESQLEADKYIIRKTLETTFEQGNMAFNSQLITKMGNYDEGQKPRNATTYREIVAAAISSQTNKDSSWIDKLNTAAKLTYISILSDRNQSNAISRIKFDLPTDRQEKYAAGEIAQNLLQKDINRLTNPYDRSSQSLFNWDTQAKLFKIAIGRRIDSTLASAVFINLLNTIETDNRSSSGRSQRVETLADLITEMDKNNVRIAGKWADKVPTCNEAHKLFYTALKTGFINPYNDESTITSSNNPNINQYRSAKEEYKADELLERIKKEKTQDIGYLPLNEIAKYRLSGLLKYSDMSDKDKIDLLQIGRDRLNEKQSLKLMAEILSNPNTEDKTAARLINEARRMRPTSTEMGKFLKAAEPFKNSFAKKVTESETMINDYNTDRQALFSAQNRDEDAQKACIAIRHLQSTIYDLKNANENNLPEYGEDTVFRLAANILDGNSKVEIEYKEPSRLKKMFMSSNEEMKQEKLRKAVFAINHALHEILQIRENKTLKEISAPLGSKESFLQVNEIHAKTQQDLAQTKTTFDKYFQPQVEDAMRFVSFAKSENIVSKLENIEANREKELKILKDKAKMNLAFAFKGQEFNDETMMAENEKRSKNTYATKAKELKGKIKQAAKEEMENRGVYEKPDIEEPNKNGHKISKESSSKVSKLMKDKKLYEKLSTEK